MGSGKEELALLAEADRLHWSPEVYGFAGSELLGAPSSFNQRVFMSFPTSPVDQTADEYLLFAAVAGVAAAGFGLSASRGRVPVDVEDDSDSAAAASTRSRRVRRLQFDQRAALVLALVAALALATGVFRIV